MALILCILAPSVGCSTLAMADDLAMAATVDTTAHTILGGVVKSVAWTDPAKSTKSEIVVIDPAGNKINIYIMSTTTLWDADVKAIMPDGIAANSRVNVIYLTTPEGINVGKSIKVLK